VSDWEQEVARMEEGLARKKEPLERREEVVMVFHEKLRAYNAVLEKQRGEQATAETKLQKLQQELDDKASNIARAEESLKAKEASLGKRATDLAWQEKDLAFREEMWGRWNKLLVEYELEAEEKEKRLEEKKQALEEQASRFQAAQVAQAVQMAPDSEAVEAMRKTLDNLRAEQCTGAQCIAAWAGEASTSLVPLGVSPIPTLEWSLSISDVLPVLDSAADHLRRLDQVLGARLEAEGSRLCRSVIEYVLTCFRSTTRLSPWVQ
jgi:chromosome segregation ATPase